MTVNRLILMAVLVAPVTNASDHDWVIVEQYGSGYYLNVDSYGSYEIPKVPGEYMIRLKNYCAGGQTVDILNRQYERYVAQLRLNKECDVWLRIYPELYKHLGNKTLFCARHFYDNSSPVINSCSITSYGRPRIPVSALDNDSISIRTTSKKWRTNDIRLTTFNAAYVTVRSDKPVTMNLKTRNISINPGAPITLTPPQSDSDKVVISELRFSVSGEITNNKSTDYNITFDTILN